MQVNATKKKDGILSALYILPVEKFLPDQHGSYILPNLQLSYRKVQSSIFMGNIKSSYFVLQSRSKED